MTRAIACLALLLCAAPALAAPTSLPAGLTAPRHASDAGAFFGSDAWRAVDPTVLHAQDLDVEVHRFGRDTLVRAVPIVDGLAVEGADRVVVFRARGASSHRAGAPLVKRSAFSLSDLEATAIASSHVRGSLFVDPTVERVGGFARAVWLAHDDGIYAAYRVRVPTLHLHDLADVYVDASTGAVLKKVPVARFADGGVDDAGGADDDAGPAEIDAGPVEVDAGPTTVDAGPRPAAPTGARVFSYAPNAAGVDELDLVDVELERLRPAFLGSYLRGDYVETFNCCKKYVCNDGSADCVELADRRCATPDDEEPITADLFLEIPTENLPIPSGIDIGEVLYARTVFCAELPRVTSSASGWDADPVDVAREINDLAGLASEEDAFAEVQVYYATMQFFLHLRDVLTDDAFCLREEAMHCEADGEPTLDSATGDPSRAYHVSTNLLIPELDATSLATQLFSGKGATPGDPLVVDDYQRVDNAAFVPALSGSPIEVPEQFQELVAIFNRPFDSNLYFQGVHDFSYDGDIVFHEFTHAVVHTFVPDLGSQWHDEQGSIADPGAMNEGWSDYFSASFTGDSQVGEYGGAGIVEGELGLRDIDNDKRCPDDLTGEVHDDSQPWSGALWDIRAAVIAAEGDAAVPDLDRALLAALAAAETNESFGAQAERVLVEIESAFGAALKASAESAFTAHGIGACERVWPLAVVENGSANLQAKGVMFSSAPSDVGTQNLAPSILQFRVEAPPSTTSIKLLWLQQNGGVGQFTGGGDPVVQQVLVLERDEPVRWSYAGVNQTATAVGADGTPLGFDPLDPLTNTVVGAPNNNGVSNGNFTVNLESDPCNARTFYVQFVNRLESVRMSNIRVELEQASEACDDNGGSDGGPGQDPPDDCNCAAASSATPAWQGALLALALAAVVVRRRRR